MIVVVTTEHLLSKLLNWIFDSEILYRLRNFQIFPMKPTKFLIASVAVFSTVAGAGAQGLLSIGSDDDFYSGLPFTTSIGVDVGYDSNPSSSSSDAEGSAYTRAGLDLAYGTGSRTTPIRIGVSGSGIYYHDGIEGQDEDLFYDARITLNVKHNVNRRLIIGNNSYVSYEIEPDLAVGASGQRRLDQYLYGYNSLWASYELSRRWSAISRYTVSGIRYDDQEVGQSEDRLTQTYSQELRYKATRQTTLVGEYRFTHTEYDEAARDYDSHHALVGLDHQFSRALTGHFRGGLEFREYNDGNDYSAPYFEVALRQRVTEDTSIHWINRLGMEDSELDSYGNRYTYRSSLNVGHSLTARLSANVGLTYLHNQFEDSLVAPDINEDTFSGSVGLSYRIGRGIDINGNYTYTVISSDDEFREFDRNRVSLGLSATF
jgi:hypothetical protein